MKKKLILITTPIVLSIIGIIFFQINRVQLLYRFQFNKINAQTNTALANAIADFNKEQKDSILHLLSRTINGPYRTSIRETSSVINLKNEYVSNLYPKSDSTAVDLKVDMNTPDSLYIYLAASNKEIQNSFKRGFAADPVKPQSVTIRSTYGRVSVELPPITLHQNKEALNRAHLQLKKIRLLISDRDNKCDPLYYPLDSVKLSRYFLKHLSMMGLGDMKNMIQFVFFCSTNRPLNKPLDLGTDIMEYYAGGIRSFVDNKRWVGVYFHNHSNKIISQIFLSTSFSVLLILVMLFCFGYLIKIILQQKRLAEMKDNFINNMTHEFKTPIATISAAIEGMQHFKVLEDKERTARYLETSKNELSRLDNLVNKVLHTAVYERNDIELIRKEINVTELITDVINSEKLKASKEVNFLFEPETNVKVLHIDLTHFRNVLTNLIDNAIKYAGISAEINIKCSADANSYTIKIKDNGIGIAKDQLNLIFDKFYRVPTGNLHAVKGTGLGLSYVKYIVERHGGTITVQSEMNKGSEFVISLPLN